MPDPDHAAEPEILPAVRCRREIDQQIPHRQQHAPRRSEEHRRRQPARGRGRAWRTRAFSTTRTASSGWKSACRSSRAWSTTTSSAASWSASSASSCSREASRAQLGADAELAERAAWLAKADLLTNMVGEFPELQGVMGRYYALADGEARARGRGDRTTLPAALCRRYAARRTRSAPAPRPRRQTGDSRRHVRHRPATDRRQGSVRAPAPRARSDSHTDRRRTELLLPTLIGKQPFSRPGCPARGTLGYAAVPISKPSCSSNDCAATCARPATPPTRSKRCLRMRPSRLDQVPRQLDAVRIAFAACPKRQVSPPRTSASPTS